MKIAFSLPGLLAGARDILPFALGAAMFGLVLGLLAAQKGLSPAEVMVMSATVFAGASQMVAAELWTAPLPALTIVMATLAINARHLLMGMTLTPWLKPLPRSLSCFSLFFMVDENWGLSVARLRRGEGDVGYLLGGGLTLYPVWIATTGLGAIFGGLVVDPRAFAMDFLPLALFLALLLMFWCGRASLLPWGTAFGVALAAWMFLPAGWHVLLGGLAGSLAGGLRDDA
ncbi:MAG: AzlC family ABC transporter permease [Kiloniellales bacterium]|nr:AzlC family ABC transporter permease [Kiloniellales bacterium]